MSGAYKQISTSNIDLQTINQIPFPPTIILPGFVLGDIPTGSGMAYPNPVLKDSGVNIDVSKNITGYTSSLTTGGVFIGPIPPAFLIAGNAIDLDNATGFPDNQVVAWDDTTKSMFIGVGTQGTKDGDLMISNQSVAAKSLTIENQRGNTHVRGQLSAIVQEMADGHQLVMNGSGVILESGVGSTLAIKPAGNPGISGQVLTSTGSAATWHTPTTDNWVHVAINHPAFLNPWVATAGPVPYNSADYPGYQVQNGTDISYNNVTSTFTVAAAGTYRVTCLQQIECGNPAPVLSDGRIYLADALLTQIGQDSGRVQTTAGLAAVSLGYNISMDIVAVLPPGTYQIIATAENGGPGLLISKGSCHFQRLA